MKCSHCYADNQPWSTVCSICGLPVLRLEICYMGHLLPPGVHDCPVCPSLWPEVDSFVGPPLLRGLLWVETGRLVGADAPGSDIAYLEIRDQGSPLSLALQPSGVVRLSTDEDQDATCRILMRPEGVLVCNKDLPNAHTGPLSYAVLPPGTRFELGRTSFRHVALRPPHWAKKLSSGSPA